MIYHESHNKYYYFTETSELKLASLSTFPFDTKFILCKDRYLQTSECGMPNCEEETPLLCYKMKVQ